jgi:uroporphyrinogen decarboxylase
MKTEWTSFERVKASLEHREPDKVPFDLGGSVLTGINKVAYQNLRRYLGLPERPVEICDSIQQLARVEQDLLEKLLVDVRCVDPGEPGVNPLQTPVVQEGDYYSWNDEWGITWKMPVKGGFYFDMRKHPLAEAETVAELEKYPWPDPLDEGRFATMKERADRFVYDEQKAYILGRNSAGIFEVALWTRGFENFFMDLALNPGFAEALLDIITEIKMKYWTRALREVGKNVLVISEADDIGTQQSLLVSREMYQKFIAPRHKKLFNYIRQNAQNKVYIFYHTCGAIKDMIPDLIDEGVDILNPVQVSAKGMDTKELKRLFGKDMTFWGGGVDTQKILPHGTPAEVKEEVKRRIEDLAPGGGFIFAAVHNVQGDVKPENFMAMWEALQEFGTYR